MYYPLRFLIPALFLIVGLVAAVVVALTSIRLSDERTEKLVAEMLTTIGNQASADVAAGLRRDDPSHSRAAIEQLQVLRGLRLAALVDETNSVVHATRSDDVGYEYSAERDTFINALLQESRSTSMPIYRVAGQRIYYASYIASAMPLFAGSGAGEHVVLLIYDYAMLRAGQRAAAVNQALIIALTIVGLSLLSWLFLRNALLGRISKLVEASRRIGRGELSEPVSVHGRDEITMLGRAMDTMRIRLAGSRDELRRAAHELEAAGTAIERERASLAERVAERTRDLTAANQELERAKDAAEAASRAKSAFLATVSHEIRTPMNGVLGAMELLERSGLDDSHALLVSTAQESASSLLGLLNDLLDMAKIEAGRIEIERQPASVQSIVDHVVAANMPAAIARRTSISSDIGREVPQWIQVDALRIQQILNNLLSNAVKFTADGSITVAVVARPVDDGQHEVHFTVRDTGVGIAPDILAKLFEPFEQGTVEIARKSGGTGLGLAICRGLAERMGGSVELASEAGNGTTATLALSVAVARAPRVRESDDFVSTAVIDVKHKVDKAGAAAIRVLVVDDHPSNRLLQVRQLEQLGINAESAAGGAEALDRIDSEPFDLVITDCEMPDMDGFDLAQRIRNSAGKNREIPVIACTAHALPEVAQRCRDVGMNDVLTKPMRLETLAEVLRNNWPSHAAPPEGDARPDSASHRILDESQLDILSGGNPARRQDLLQSFTIDCRKAVREVTAALARDDFAHCHATAHRSKGACAIFGASALGAAFAELENRARRQPPDAVDVASSLRQIEAERLRLEKALSALA